MTENQDGYQPVPSSTSATPPPKNPSDVPAPIDKANAELVPGRGLVPRNLEELYRMAVAFCKSGLMPKGMQRPEQVIVAVQMGMELNLTFMQSIRNIAVINGRPSLWGDMPLALVKRSKELEYIREGFEEREGADFAAVCIVKRKGEEEISRVWSWGDAVQASLHEKDTYKKYPRRMCQMRARSWALKDAFPDIISGVGIAEYDDYQPGPIIDADPATEEPEASPSITELIGSEPESAIPPMGGIAENAFAEAVGEAFVDMKNRMDGAHHMPEEGTRRENPETGDIEQFEGGQWVVIEKAPDPGSTGELMKLQAKYDQALAEQTLPEGTYKIVRAYRIHLVEMGLGPAETLTRAIKNIEQHVVNAVKWHNARAVEKEPVAGDRKTIEGQEHEFTGHEWVPVPPDTGRQDSPGKHPTEDEQAFINEWFRLRSTGFKKFVTENVGRFRDASIYVNNIARDKWRRLSDLKDLVYPPDEKETAPPESSSEPEISTQGGDPAQQGSGGGQSSSQGDDANPNREVFASAEWRKVGKLAREHPESYAAVSGDFNLADPDLSIETINRLIEAIRQHAEGPAH